MTKRIRITKAINLAGRVYRVGAVFDAAVLGDDVMRSLRLLTAYEELPEPHETPIIPTPVAKPKRKKGS